MGKTGENWGKLGKTGKNWGKLGKTGENCGKLGKIEETEFLAIFSSFHEFSSVLISFGQFWSVLVSFGQFWSVLNSLEIRYNLFTINYSLHSVVPTSAPCFTSSCTAAKCPPLHARWSGVMSRISAPSSFSNGPESAFQSVPCCTKGKNPKIVFHRTKSDKLCLIAQRNTY